MNLQVFQEQTNYTFVLFFLWCPSKRMNRYIRCVNRELDLRPYNFDLTSWDTQKQKIEQLIRTIVASTTVERPETVRRIRHITFGDDVEEQPIFYEQDLLQAYERGLHKDVDLPVVIKKPPINQSRLKRPMIPITPSSQQGAIASSSKPQFSYYQVKRLNKYNRSFKYNPTYDCESLVWEKRPGDSIDKLYVKNDYTTPELGRIDMIKEDYEIDCGVKVPTAENWLYKAPNSSVQLYSTLDLPSTLLRKLFPEGQWEKKPYKFEKYTHVAKLGTNGVAQLYKVTRFTPKGPELYLID